MRSSLWVPLLLSSSLTFACENGNGVRYCDSSAGLNVSQNGDYGSSYCTRHAIMDMQKFAGFCVWHGGVAKITVKQEIICNDGSESELGTLRNRQFDENVGFVTEDNAPKEPSAKALFNYKYKHGQKTIIN